MSSLLTDILLSVGAVIDLEASLPAVKKFVTLLFSHCVEQCRKVKHHVVSIIWLHSHVDTPSYDVILCRHTFHWLLLSSLFVKKNFFYRTGDHFSIATYCQTLGYVSVVMVTLLRICNYREMLKFSELSWNHFTDFFGSMWSASSVKGTSQLKSEILANYLCTLIYRIILIVDFV